MCNLSVMVSCFQYFPGFLLQPIEQGTDCDYRSFSNDNTNPVKAVAPPPFPGINTSFSEITTIKGDQKGPDKVKITTMGIYTR
jgi:hypothetical protein